jgi:hypothetical protein
MLRLLAQPDASPLAALTAAPLATAVAPPAPALQAGAVKKPSRGWRVRQWWKNLRDGSFLIPLYARVARRLGLVVMYSELRGRVTHADGSVTDYGLLGRRVVTDAGVAFLASAFDNTVEPEILKYAGFGTGTTAEAAGQTALVTELTTEYATDNTRPTGSQAHGSNTYTTVATLAINNGGSSTYAITEHAIFSQAAVAGGTMWDRTKFSAVNLVDQADSLAATYVLTLPSGG